MGVPRRGHRHDADGNAVEEDVPQRVVVVGVRRLRTVEEVGEADLERVGARDVRRGGSCLRRQGRKV